MLLKEVSHLQGGAQGARLECGEGEKGWNKVIMDNLKGAFGIRIRRKMRGKTTENFVPIGRKKPKMCHLGKNSNISHRKNPNYLENYSSGKNLVFGLYILISF